MHCLPVRSVYPTQYMGFTRAIRGWHVTLGDTIITFAKVFKGRFDIGEGCRYHFVMHDRIVVINQCHRRETDVCWQIVPFAADQSTMHALLDGTMIRCRLLSRQSERAWLTEAVSPVHTPQ